MTSGGSGGDSDDITLLDWILIACLGALAVFCLFGCGMLYSKTKDYHLRHTENYAQLRDWITEIRQENLNLNLISRNVYFGGLDIFVSEGTSTSTPE